MKFRLKPQLRGISDRLVTARFLLILFVLSGMTLLALWISFVSARTLLFGLFVRGFQSIVALVFAVAFTAAVVAGAWFFFSRLRGVWMKFSSHRIAVKASAGS